MDKGAIRLQEQTVKKFMMFGDSKRRENLGWVLKERWTLPADKWKGGNPIQEDEPKKRKVRFNLGAMDQLGEGICDIDKTVK